MEEKIKRILEKEKEVNEFLKKFFYDPQKESGPKPTKIDPDEYERIERLIGEIEKEIKEAGE